ncbi:MAG: 50S ribosomal protein L21e [Thermoplasmata archaeon]|nr:50S ribosomal protein L21e [Thermoplasmata archaeon]
MVQRSHGFRVKTRRLLRKHPRHRGMPPVTHTLLELKEGDKAAIVIDPSVHKGMPHRRFQGLTGVVVGKRGDAYILQVRVGDKMKTVLSRPEHLRKMEQ